MRVVNVSHSSLKFMLAINVTLRYSLPPQNNSKKHIKTNQNRPSSFVVLCLRQCLLANNNNNNKNKERRGEKIN